ncbi:MAG TPA: ArsB/NhaD family transporter [Ktedonobacteraceae bacterium]|nr:ArsB/NhaD family transporter [Ktedonobacteraceae bacterium]
MPSSHLPFEMFLFFHLPTLTRTLLTALIGILTLVGIMTRPFKWNEALIAMAGAVLLLILGLISPVDAATTLYQDWNTFLFFLGMMSLSALAEAAGIFDWLAVQAARFAGNSAARLFLNTFLLGSLISMILSNDATALILTPIVYTLVTRLRLPVLPFLFACTFIADTASFLLPVSNPINIIVLSKFPLGLWVFLRLLFLPALLVISINIAAFFLLYRRQLRGSFDIKRLPSAEEAVKHRGYFRYTCVVLIVVAIAYIIAAATQFPLSLIAVGGALLLCGGAFFWHQATLQYIGRQISWSIFGFIGGMFIVVRAVEDTGLTTQFGQLLLHLSGGTSFGAVMVGTLGAAIGTNLINNVPMAVVLTSALKGIQHSAPGTSLGFTVATMFGCDLGPNLTTVGSLATVLWLLILRRRNLDVSGLDYFKVGVMVTPLMLLAGALVIWLLLL